LLTSFVDTESTFRWETVSGGAMCLLRFRLASVFGTVK